MKRVLAFLLVFAASCDDGLTPIAPKPHWRELWRQVESCSGLSGDFDAVHWVITSAIPGAAGAVNYELRTVYLRPASAEDDGLVAHEMLHMLQFFSSDTLDFSSRGHPSALGAACPIVVAWAD